MNELKFRKLVRSIVQEQLSDEHQDDINSIEVGDVVDVEGPDTIGQLPVRVIELVDDVRKAVGMPDDEYPSFSGPGFVGEIDPDSGESGSLVFALHDVLPGSKAKGYFPKEDDWGRPDPTGGRRQARATFSTRANDYGSEWADPDEKEYNRIMGLGEADKPEARRADHADPSGRNWDSGLDETDHADPTGRNWDSGLDETDDLGGHQSPDDVAREIYACINQARERLVEISMIIGDEWPAAFEVALQKANRALDQMEALAKKST